VNLLQNPALVCNTRSDVAGQTDISRTHAVGYTEELSFISLWFNALVSPWLTTYRKKAHHTSGMERNVSSVQTDASFHHAWMSSNSYNHAERFLSLSLDEELFSSPM